MFYDFAVISGPYAMPSPSQTFHAHLSAFSVLCQGANPDPRDLQGRFLTVQQVFQQQILPLSTASHPGIQPLLTEMNRTLRLVAMDVAFLQTARQSITRQQRQRQMLTKLTQLDAFATSLQQSLDPDDLDPDGLDPDGLDPDGLDPD